jgi:SsrA-binding protein
MTIIAKNKKAFYDYEIIEKFEAGMELLGSEVKAIRATRVNLKESFIRITKGEAILYGMHISHLSTANLHYRPDEKRARRLLLHKREILKLFTKATQAGYSIVPLKLYFNKRNRAKLEIALAKGKNIHDKRETIKKRDADREAQSAMKRYR